MKKLIILILFAIITFGLMNGCQTFSDKIPLETKSKAERQIAALNALYAIQLKSKDDAIDAAKHAVDIAKAAQLQAASNAFFAIDRIFHIIPAPLRTDLMFNNFAQEGWVATGHLMPDYATMLAINDRITKELDATKTSLAQLQSEHDAALAANTKLSDDAKTAQAKVTALDAEKVKLTADHDAALAADQKSLNDANDEVIAREKAIADDAKAIQALKTKVSSICAIIALIATVAAIYLPVGRTLAIVIGIVAAAGGTLIWVITGQEVLIGCGVVLAVVLLGAIGWFVYKHFVTDKALNSYVAAHADLATTNPTLAAQVAPTIAAYQTTYVKAPDGTVTTKPDTAVAALVQTKLQATDRA